MNSSTKHPPLATCPKCQIEGRMNWLALDQYCEEDGYLTDEEVSKAVHVLKERNEARVFLRLVVPSKLNRERLDASIKSKRVRLPESANKPEDICSFLDGGDEIQPTHLITQAMVEKLKQAGYVHWADLQGKTTHDMLNVKGIGRKKANQIMDAARSRLK